MKFFKMFKFSNLDIKICRLSPRIIIRLIKFLYLAESDRAKSNSAQTKPLKCNWNYHVLRYVFTIFQPYSGQAFLCTLNGLGGGVVYPLSKIFKKDAKMLLVKRFRKSRNFFTQLFDDVSVFLVKNGQN